MIDEKKLIEEIDRLEEKYDELCGAAQMNEEYGMEMMYAGKVTGLHEIKKFIMNQPKVGEWIPCSDRLPEDRKEKMVYLSSNRITIAKYNEHRLPHTGSPIGWVYIPKNGYIDFENETVIAWMPLPEPYKGE